MDDIHRHERDDRRPDKRGGERCVGTDARDLADGPDDRRHEEEIEDGRRGLDDPGLQVVLPNLILENPAHEAPGDEGEEHQHEDGADSPSDGTGPQREVQQDENPAQRQRAGSKQSDVRRAQTMAVRLAPVTPALAEPGIPSRIEVDCHCRSGDRNMRRARSGFLGPALIWLALAVSPVLAGAEPGARTGPVIEGFGPTFTIPNPDFRTPVDDTFRVVFDVGRSSEPPGQVNPRIETVARFLNMHARAGVDAERIHLALVIHGEASRDVLNETAYRGRFDFANSNLALLDELRESGVEIILCGQTAMHRGIVRGDLAEGVQLALSAMTALTVLQNDGYALIAF